MAKFMSELQFWQQKLLQILHDPPAKPFEMMPGAKGEARGGHKEVAKQITTTLTDTPIKYFRGVADCAAAGADRPVFPGAKDSGGSIQLRWPKAPIITHPLSPRYTLIVRSGGIDETTAGVEEAVSCTGDDEPFFTKEEATGYQDAMIDQLIQEMKATPSGKVLWQNSASLKKRFFIVWRKLRYMLINQGLNGDNDPGFRLLWQVMPADTRCPDHTIWEHNRLASALSFMTDAKGDLAARAPWLFRFEIGPVGRFINESRTSRDLWMGSFLLSDLIFHAMQPVIERYGPDCILYPDLRENPLADLWLQKNCAEALPDTASPGSYAAVLPNTFTAVLPLGDEQAGSHLRPLKEEIAKACKERLEDRWLELSNTVKVWLTSIQGQSEGSAGTWHSLWDSQQKGVVQSTWSAIRWTKAESINDSASITFRDPLPCQEARKEIPDSLDADILALQKRADRLRPFVSDEIWAHYDHAKAVFAGTNRGIHQCERGFDYALTHHQLRIRHGLRKFETPDTGIFNQGGEKCTLCGKRQAIYDRAVDKDRFHSHRAAARAFWAGKTEDAQKRLNPDPVQQDRLCGVCATKRFLVEASLDDDDQLTGINENWAGTGFTVDKLGFSDKIPRVPFPSTATIAAQHYLQRICNQREMENALSRVVQAWQAAQLPRTGFAGSLKMTRELAQKGNITVSSFLKLDTQGALFPETIDIAIRRAKQESNQNALKTLRNAVVNLRQQARSTGLGNPNTQIAIVRMDGDNMGRLLLGDPKSIQTTWRDVLHPAVIGDKENSQAKTLLTHEKTIEAGWPALLNSKRLMGPSLHAFISRALGVFGHRIVPWVVEQEFPGRLIYSGGDDVLAMVPATHALDMAARLQQLFSAPFVVDTAPDQPAWGWRFPENTVPENTSSSDNFNPRDRFLIPTMPDQGVQKRPPCIELPTVDIEPFLYDGYTYSHHLEEPVHGEVIPLLGKPHSLSAGIAYGHFKYPLKGLLDQSEKMLETCAKKLPGKRAVGISHFSRNGIKSEFTMPWGRHDRETEHHGLSNLETLHRVMTGFKMGALPKRLPYKLQQVAPLRENLDAMEHKDQLGVLLDGLFITALDASKKNVTGYQEAALALWRQGILSHSFLKPSNGNCPADGLIIARMLSALEA